MKANDNSKKQTVMLAADVGSYSITTVSLAVQMAASMNTRLRGLFIEDEDLLQLTSLPISREISLTTARERPTEVDQMQRSMRSVARQFEQTLKQEARALQIAWSFDYVRGRVRDIGLKSDSDVIYTILGQPISHRLRARAQRAPRRILLISNESRHQKHALEVVLDRFSHEKIELTIVSEKPGNKVVADIARLSQDNVNRVILNEMTRDHLFDLLTRLGSTFDCAVMSRHEKPEELSRILKSLSCPVILVA